MKEVLQEPLAKVYRAGRLFLFRALPPWGNRPRYPYEQYWNPSSDEIAREVILTGESSTDCFEAAGQMDAERIQALVPDKSSVLLDYGCGIGRITKHLTGYSQIYGVDVSQRMLNLARQRIPDSHVTFLKTDGRQIPVPENSIDFLYSLLVLQHLDRGDAWRVVGDCYRVLKPSGRCYLQFPEYGDMVDGGANTRPWSVAEVQEVLREWSILSLERQPDHSGLINILVLAQPKKVS